MSIRKIMGTLVITVFVQTVYAEGLADRRNEVRTPADSGFIHPHTMKNANQNPHDVSGYTGDSHAERMRIKAEDASVVEHAHRMMGAPAAGHPHEMHRHTFKGSSVPDQYQTAHERKRYMVDHVGPGGF